MPNKPITDLIIDPKTGLPKKRDEINIPLGFEPTASQLKLAGLTGTPAVGPQPAPGTPTPTIPASVAKPTGVAKVDYGNLVNRNGAIVDIKTGKQYSSNEQLAADLGIPPHQIDWTKINPEGGTPGQNILAGLGVETGVAAGGGLDAQSIQDIMKLFQPQETEDQKKFREQQQGTLDRLINLEKDLAKAKTPTPELASLRKSIAEQQKVLEELTPESFLETEPGLKDVGITQAGLERRVAAARDPIARTLSNLLTSHSLLAEEQQREIAGLTAEQASLQNITQLRESISKLKPEAFELPESIQSKILEAKLFPKTGELLSVSEAAKLGVPYGTTKAQAVGMEVPEAEQISTFTDERGVVTAVNKRTSEILWQKQIGRAGTAGPNISVNTITDPVTGAPNVIEIKNKDTGTVEYRDITTGEIVDPSEVQIKEPKDSLEQFIDSVVGDILGEVGL